jgi:hypothetical protein
MTVDTIYYVMYGIGACIFGPLLLAAFIRMLHKRCRFKQPLPKEQPKRPVGAPCQCITCSSTFWTST